jgi:uncharacterized RDD family membrane protein YckC
VRDWYYVQAGHPYGPFSLEQLRQRLAVMPADTLVWHGELTAWTPANALPETSTPIAPVAPTVVTPAVVAAPGPYAEWPLRAASMLVDQLVVFGIPVVIFALLHALRWTDEHGDPKGIGLVLWIAALLAGLALGLWNRIFLDGTTGRSLGRQVTGTRLVGLATGRPIGMPTAFVRQIAHFLDHLPCVCAPVGFFMPLWDARRQTIADKIMNTVVVRETPRPGEAPPPEIV